jgi:hypothetical protein
MLLNPGYGRNSVFCCGKSRRWYSTTDVVVEITHENGRDNRGRYARKPSIQRKELSRTVRIVGGE